MKRVKSSNLSFNLDTVIDKARRDSSMTRNSVIKYLEQGVDSPMGTASSNDTSHEQEEDQTGMESLKRQLEFFLLPEESAFSSVMQPQQEKDHCNKVHHREKWFIHPYGAFRFRWDMIIIVIMAISVVVIPMEAAYFESDDSETVEWIVFNVISDIFFMVDIAFNFRTGIVVREEYDRVVMDPWIIAKDYLGHWFIVDIISGFPFDYALALVTMSMEYSDSEGKTNSFAKAAKLLQLSKFLKLCKLLRLSKLIRYLSSFEENYFFYSTGVYFRLFNCIAVLCLIAHWNACLQFFVPRMQDFPADSWVSKQKLTNSSWWEQYSWSMYNAMSQMVSCGYGRTAAENTTEAWLTCLGMASGTIGYALLLGLCANMIQTMDHTRRLHREKLKEVEDYMQYQKLPKPLRNRIRDYFENRYGGRVFDEANILKTLSDPLREEVLNYNIRTTVRTVPFFAQADPELVADLVLRLKPEFFQPRDVIVKQGTVGHKMYFVQAGRVSVTMNDGQVVGTASEGAHFGERCLLMKARRRANVIAETYCHLLSLSDDDFHQALEGRPLMKKAMEELVREQQSQQSVAVPD